MVRAKFVCSYKKDDYVSFSPVISGSDENKQFFQYTPGGEIRLFTVNPRAMSQFELGAEYYVDFISMHDTQMVKDGS